MPPADHREHAADELSAGESRFRGRGWIIVREKNQPKVSTTSKGFFSRDWFCTTAAIGTFFDQAIQY